MPPAARSLAMLVLFPLLGRSHYVAPKGQAKNTRLQTAVVTPTGDVVFVSGGERERAVRSRAGGSLAAASISSSGKAGGLGGQPLPHGASLSDAGGRQRFWIPPVHEGSFGELMEWRRRNVRSIRPGRLATMSDRSFLQLLRREHRAADVFGNGDGCVTSDEHPDFSLFVAYFGRSADSVCTSQVLRYARSPSFRRDVANVRSAHRRLMLIIKSAREETLAKVDEELTNISQELPLSRELTPNETDASIERSEQNMMDLEAELRAEQVHLRTMNNTQYAMDVGLMPFTYTDKDEEKEDVVKLSEKAGIKMDVPSLWEKMERESPDLARALTQASSTLMRRSHSSSGTFTVSGPCRLSDDKQCVSSPCLLSADKQCISSTYGNNQQCWIKASADMTLRVDKFDTENYWDWLYVDGTYYSGMSGPAGRGVKANAWMAWYSDHSETRPGWKICSDTSAATVPCLYGRHDLCALQLRQVPLLGAHNSGSNPTLYLECGRKKQVCVDWATRARETCNEHVHECTTWGTEVRKECNSWGTECTSWANRYCGLFYGWLCGSFCTSSRQVCTGFTDVTHAVCHAYGWVCKGFTYFVEYVGCNAYKWACEAASDIGIIGCLWENQGHNVLGQLARGVRYVDFDTCLVNAKLFNCHGSSYEQRAIGTEVEPDIKRIFDWLEGNPNEVLAIGWSDVEHGLSGIDYPASESNVADYHERKRQELIDKYFTLQNGTRCEKVCYARDDTMRLGDMISNNIRLVVGGRNNGLYQQDSYTDESSKFPADVVMSHMEAFCDGTVDGFDGKLVAGNTAGLAMFVGLQSTAAYREGGTYNLECPNHCTHPNGQPARCECKAGAGKVLTLTVPNEAMVEGAGGMNESGESQLACNSLNAGVVNQKVSGRLLGIVDKCYARNSSVSVIMVDYVEKSNSDIQHAVQVAINTAVTKFR
jgi:hypothetical protein